MLREILENVLIEKFETNSYAFDENLYREKADFFHKDLMNIDSLKPMKIVLTENTVKFGKIECNIGSANALMAVLGGLHIKGKISNLEADLFVFSKLFDKVSERLADKNLFPAAIDLFFKYWKKSKKTLNPIYWDCVVNVSDKNPLIISENDFNLDINIPLESLIFIPAEFRKTDKGALIENNFFNPFPFYAQFHIQKYFLKGQNNYLITFRSEALRYNKKGELGFLEHGDGIGFFGRSALGNKSLDLSENEFTLDALNSYIKSISEYSKNGCPFELSPAHFKKIKTLLKG